MLWTFPTHVTGSIYSSLTTASLLQGAALMEHKFSVIILIRRLELQTNPLGVTICSSFRHQQALLGLIAPLAKKKCSLRERLMAFIRPRGWREHNWKCHFCRGRHSGRQVAHKGRIRGEWALYYLSKAEATGMNLMKL
jgi:hypothetical protein